MSEVQEVCAETLCVKCNEYAWSPSLLDDDGVREFFGAVADVLWSELDDDTYGWPVQCSTCSAELAPSDEKYLAGIVWVNLG